MVGRKKQKLGHGEMFPEHGGKVIDTLLSLSQAKVGKEDPSWLMMKPHNGEQRQESDEDIKQDTMVKLKKLISAMGGELGDGWEVEIQRSKGRLDKIFLAPNKKKLRSRLQVARYLGLQGRQKGDVNSDEGIQGLLPDDTPQPYHTGKQEENSDRDVEFIQPHGKRDEYFPASRKDHDNGSGCQRSEQTKNNTVKSAAADMLDAVQHKKELLSCPALINQRCQDVLHAVLSDDKFGTLCSMFQHSPNSWEKGFQTSALITGALDFQLLNLRMAVGAYGKTPEMFLVDFQKVWMNIQSIGSEMVHLADSLSDLSETLYKEQVATLIAAKTMQEDGHGDDLQENIKGRQTLSLYVPGPEEEQVHVRENLPNEHRVNDSIVELVGITENCQQSEKGSTFSVIQKNSNPASAEKETHDFDRIPSQITPYNISGPIEKKSGCKFCKSMGDTDYIFCISCKAEYHRHCVVEVSALPNTAWKCPACAATLKDESLVPDPRKDLEGLPLVLEPLRITRKDCLCKLCGKDDLQVLLCDSCESAYHMHCLSPPLKVVPEGNWYCPACTEDGKIFQRQLHAEHEPSSHHCAVCDRMVASEEPAVSVGTNPVQYDPLMGRVCKLCGIDDKRYLLSCDACSKPYHMTCLNPPLKKTPSTWYCPSCLCRVCKVDSDDDKILLCDGCDEGYHTFCLSPPLENIPEGLWYCPSCIPMKAMVSSKEHRGTFSFDNPKISVKLATAKELPKRKRRVWTQRG